MAQALNTDNFHQEVFEDVESDENLTESESGQILNQEEEVIEEPVVVSEESDEQTEELAEADKPKFDDKHFQKIADKRLAELTKLQMETERLQNEINAFKAPKQSEPEIVEPVEPVMPEDYDINDLYDRTSSTYKYELDNKKYVKDLANYTKSLVKTLNAEKVHLKQMNEATQAKANTISQFMQHGKTMLEAQEVHDWAVQLISEQGLTADRLIAFYDFEKKNKTAPKQVLKNKDLDSRVDKAKLVLPPGVVGSESPKAISTDDAFNQNTFTKKPIRTI